MTGRERMLKVLSHDIPDRVPCCPDISVMIPLKLKRRPFWEFFIDFENINNISDLFANNMVMRAYVDAVRFFGIEGWAIYGNVKIKTQDISYSQKILEKRCEKIITRVTMHTPEGDLWAETVYPIFNPPVPYRKFIKDFKKDFKFLKYFYPELDEVDFSPLIDQKEYVGEDGVNGISVFIPSLIHLDGIIDGGLGKIGLLYFDYPELFKRYKEMHENWTIIFLKKIIESNKRVKMIDEIITGGSGLITWQGPRITKELSLDGLKQITNLCKENNIISHVHCCGFEKQLVQICADETNLDAIEPLEPPPQGDCDLKEIKEKYGKKLVIKGNLHTSKIMLSDVTNVEKAAIKCIMDAAEGGGYILSTGDQCGRDTPLENIFKLVEVCEEYGKY